MLKLNISDNKELKLVFSENNVQRFSMCKLLYNCNNSELSIYEDYLYTFIEGILGRIRKIPNLNQVSMFGKVGEWQECFYYDMEYIKRNKKSVEMMERSVFISAENYGSFLYEFDGNIWFELNKGYRDDCELSPFEYYRNYNNYRILLTSISRNNIREWERELEKIERKVLINE